MKWWPYRICPVCNRRFRRGKGGGYTREVVCSEKCWQWAYEAITGRKDDE